jgi:hypothetical protein
VSSCRRFSVQHGSITIGLADAGFYTPLTTVD